MVLIEPAAYGGNRETDLAMLALFGCPRYNAFIEGYESVQPLNPSGVTALGSISYFRYWRM